MKCIVHNMTPCYEQSFMPYFRSYMMRELMAGRCFPEPLAVTATSDTDKEVSKVLCLTPWVTVKSGR